MTNWADYGLPPDGEPLPDAGHEPGDEHCGVGGRPAEGHPHYRRCRCGQWYHYSGSGWYMIAHPPRKWLKEHGYGDLGDGWDLGAPGGRSGGFGEFRTSGPSWRYRLRLLLRRR